MRSVTRSRALRRAIFLIFGLALFATFIVPALASAGTQTITNIAGKTITKKWDFTYSSTTGDKARASILSPDNSRLFLTGTDDADAFTVAVNTTTGAEIWRDTFDGSGADFDTGACLAISPDGATLYVAGQSNRTVGAAKLPTFLVIAYNATTGGVVWSHQESALFTSSSADLPVQMCFTPDPDGGGSQVAMVVVTGVSINTPFPGQSFYGTVAYNAATGAVVWKDRFHTNTTKTFDPFADPVITTATAIACDANRVYVSGTDYRAGGVGLNAFDSTTHAYNRGTGTTAWTHSHNGPDNKFDATLDMALSADGTQIIAGGVQDLDFTVMSGSPKPLLIALNASTGGLNWEKDFSADVTDAGIFALTVGSNDSGQIGTGAPGRIYFSGNGNTIAPNAFGYWAGAVNPNGSVVWGPSVYDGGTPSDDSVGPILARAIVARKAPAGFNGEWVYVTGTESVSGSTNSDLTTLAIVGFKPVGAPDPVSPGDLLWDARLNGAANGNDGALAYFDANAPAEKFFEDIPGDQLVTVSSDGSTIYAVGTVTDASTSYAASAYQYSTAIPPSVTLLAPSGTPPVLVHDTEVGGVLGTQVTADASAGDFPLAGTTLDLIVDGVVEDAIPFNAGSGHYEKFERTIRTNVQPFDCSNEGTHTLTLRATDTMGNIGSDSLLVNVDNTTFPDVACSDGSFLFVEALVRNAIAAGFPDGTYKPTNIVNRGAMSVFMSRTADRTLGTFAAFTPPACGSETFTDVDCANGSYKFIEYVAANGIAGGFPDGTYKPANVVTRSAMAVFLARVRDLTDGDLAAFTPPAPGSETFPDVPSTHPSYKFIEYIVSKGIASGFPDGTYRPANAVTRGQMGIFITRTADLVF